jgi:hypothetical protein
MILATLIFVLATGIIIGYYVGKGTNNIKNRIFFKFFGYRIIVKKDNNAVININGRQTDQQPTKLIIK